MSHKVFTHDTFDEAFEADLAVARCLVLMQSPFLTVRRIKRFYGPFSKCVRRGVRVCMFIQDPSTESNLYRIAEINASADLLKKIGVHVSPKPKAHEKLIVIDNMIAWDGSLNMMSYRDTSERMTRWISPRKVREIISTHHLDECVVCSSFTSFSICADDGTAFRERQFVGNLVRQHRELLGMSQQELADKVGIPQSTIYAVEHAARDVRVGTMVRIMRQLGLYLRAIPWHLVPYIDERLSKEMNYAQVKSPVKSHK